jgi:catechol 2,3-dioxygenase-like lactoylglutathione lyase family enzyme
MATRLEHANLCVRDVDGMLRFLRTAFPEFRIRHEAVDEDGTRWVHVGTDETYLTLNDATAEPAEPWRPYTGRPGVNHLGFEVDDATGLRERMLAAGYRQSGVPNDHPARTRVYFNDLEGNDWEFVQYHTEDRALRHEYESS